MSSYTWINIWIAFIHNQFFGITYCINLTIQVVVGPIPPLFTAGVEVARESLSPCKTVLLQANVTDGAHPYTRNYRTNGKLIRTERDSVTPRDASSSKMRSRLSFQSPKFVAISVSLEKFREQDIVNPRHPGSIVKRDRSAEPFSARINGHPDKNGDSPSLFSHVVGLEEVSREVSDVDASERMNFASNTVLGETQKFVDLRLSTVNTADKLNSIFAPVAKAEGFTDHSDWIASRHRIEEVTEVRVSEV